MVTKQSDYSREPEIDESWWTALLADEEKYRNTGYRELIQQD
jgi:hypothetical protein